jgi:hypothetical protein
MRVQHSRYVKRRGDVRLVDWLTLGAPSSTQCGAQTADSHKASVAAASGSSSGSSAQQQSAHLDAVLVCCMDPAFGWDGHQVMAEVHKHIHTYAQANRTRGAGSSNAGSKHGSWTQCVGCPNKQAGMSATALLGHTVWHTPPSRVLPPNCPPLNLHPTRFLNRFQNPRSGTHSPSARFCTDWHLYCQTAVIRNRGTLPSCRDRPVAGVDWKPWNCLSAAAAAAGWGAAACRSPARLL